MLLRSLASTEISAITWMEALVGARDNREQQAMRAFRAGYDVLAVDDVVAEEAVKIRRSQRLRLTYAIILATALVHRRDLATRNTRDFPAGPPGAFVPYRIS